MRLDSLNGRMLWIPSCCVNATTIRHSLTSCRASGRPQEEAATMHRALAGNPRSRKALALAAVVSVAAVATALAATASARTTGKTISVAIVANPQMQDIASLTPSLFTSKTGIKVKYTILDEGKLREVTTRDVGSGGKAFDAVMIGMYETPQFGTAGLLQDLTAQAKSDKTY